MIITIDGPVSAGKTTVAREVATRLDFSLLDTGAIYRSLAFHARRSGVCWSDEAGLAAVARALALEIRLRDGDHRVVVNGEDITPFIRDPEISTGASLVSALPAVRAELLLLQRDLAAREMGVVAEGRDTGTVVFPDADAKFFLTAAPRERARRRHRQLREHAIDCGFAEVLADLEERDHRDSSRPVAPLVRPTGAALIDTTELTVAEVVERILDRLSSDSEGR